MSRFADWLPWQGYCYTLSVLGESWGNNAATILTPVSSDRQGECEVKWTRGYQSNDVVDNRGRSAGGFGGGGSLGPLVALGSRFGIGGIVVAVGIYFVSQYFAGGGSSLAVRGDDPAGQQPTKINDEPAQFVGFV